MRDMEIRGVGNLLGVEQSGQMETIGFDLYMEMLQESLAEIQGQDIPAVEDTQVDLPVTAFVPADWITDPDEKSRLTELQPTASRPRLWWSWRLAGLIGMEPYPLRFNRCCS